MKIKNLKFAKSEFEEFEKSLHKRVNNYFKKNNKSRFGNSSLIYKTIIMLSTFFIPLIIINTGIVENTLLLFTLYIISGIGMAGVGMGVMHDAIHGSYSKNPKINKYVGYSMNLIGANAKIWRIQHNVLHHTYTNIDHADDDIHTPFFLRFSPNAKKHWIHRFQHLYVWFFYSLTTLSWITLKDFINLIRYKKKGLVKENMSKAMLRILAWKGLYYSYALVLPLIMVSLPAWIIILAFLSMHLVTGLCISFVFQTAHVMPNTEYPLADSNNHLKNSRMVHQMATTTNFAPKSRFFSWLIGGLNFQVEHHLFPHISHVHYHQISKIVERTANEYNIPYLSYDNFWIAIKAHFKMIKKLGTQSPKAIS
ncbi:fatty acid desaturase family protein [Marinigracilibium pacificum]|nr:acyl-CoA desaturase [Marinigracilibium pacificum]